MKKYFKIPPNLPFPKGGEILLSFPALGRIRRGEEKGGIKGLPLFQKGKIPLIPLFGKEGLGEILKILFWTDVWLSIYKK
ncbi:MAG: hypothetical protein ACOYU4_00195 [Thermodesulfobacteriota bacterium]